MTQDTPGTNAMQPNGGFEAKRGKVVYSTDGKVLTEEEGRPANPEPVEENES